MPPAKELPRPGQRWMSASEPELGLGLVLEADPTRVRILFPGSQEMRNYALESAPLVRVRFAIGDTVESPDGDRFRVETVEDQNGLLTYRGEGQSLPESRLADSLTDQGPKERLLMGETDPAEAFQTRIEVWQQLHRLWQHPGLGLMGGRIDWIQHQIAIAREVSRRMHPRVLLADEVGLGKTIEACLILHHGILTGRIRRALILVPEALIHQWFVELLRRFNLSFSLYDTERCEAAGDRNPFLEEQCVLAPLSLLAESDKHRDAAVEAGWDLLIVDEAHHLAWAKDAPSPAYTAVEALAAAVDSVILLTATPEQRGLESHFAHLRLLDPDRYPDLDTFTAEQSGYAEAAKTAETLRAEGDTDALKALLRRHGPGRVMFRNTRDVVPGFPRRLPCPVLLPDTPEAKTDWLAAFLEDNPDEKVLVMTQSPEAVLALQSELQKRTDPSMVLFHEGQTLIERDRQAAWFADPEGARLMIASDIGGEGRNFQFVRHLVLLDLPADPERIEQRIGRLDRIGQKSDIHIHLPVRENTPEAGLLRWLHEGLDMFHRPLQCGHRCLEAFEDRLEQVDDGLIQETRAAVERWETELREGHHRLLRWKHELETSPDRDLALLRSSDQDPDLLPFAEKLWEHFGLNIEPLRDQDYHLHAGQFYTGELPLREEGLRFTPSRTRALEREDLDLLTWDHPLIRDGIEALLSARAGTVGCVKAEALEYPCLQALYILDPMAPAGVPAHRFLPPTPLLFTVDALGREHKTPLELSGEGDPSALLNNASFRTDWLPARIENTAGLAKFRGERLRQQALASATETLDKEIKRLRDLREINDHIRESEIEALETEKDHILTALRSAKPRLESLRLVLPA
ncbi:MAG: DEAD/DEAH box helicase family protein [Verrucomicrobia bacterium]|nr:DEAD/DEAH box helicase family protein [Verrucomicrobiota bacterium]MCH8525955.1 DEAD/DEAH box helicase family protein [Kiritimatiellia bacterium]